MEDTTAATVLLLDLPPRSLGGIDLLSFTTTPRFKGIKNLPPGWHFAFASPTESLSLRHGCWFHVSDPLPTSPPQLFITRWDAPTETLVPETSPPQILHWRANLGAIWRDGLSPYRQRAPSSSSEDAHSAQDESAAEHDWRHLTQHISPALLDRVCGRHEPPGYWTLSSASSARSDADALLGLSTPATRAATDDDADSSADAVDAFVADAELRFLPVDLRQTWRAGATGRERTAAAQDRSWALNELVARRCGAGGAEEVLGEMQMCFVMVLTLNNYSCLEQWKRLLGLLLTCRDVVVRGEGDGGGERGVGRGRAGLFVKALRVLRGQLARVQDVAEGGLFDLSEDGAALLIGLLRRFRKGLDMAEGAASEVRDEFEELEEFVRSEFGWYLDESFVKRGMLDLEDGERVEVEVDGYEEDDERGEYAPMVVELTEDQKKGLWNENGGRSLQTDEEEDDTNAEDFRY